MKQLATVQKTAYWHHNHRKSTSRKNIYQDQPAWLVQDVNALHEPLEPKVFRRCMPHSNAGPHYSTTFLNVPNDPLT